MGSGSDKDKIAKKVYSTAYQRALSSLKAKHKAEFETLLAAHKANVRFELETFGEIESLKGQDIVHVTGENGKCERCGKEAPCRWERERLARAGSV